MTRRAVPAAIPDTGVAPLPAIGSAPAGADTACRPAASAVLCRAWRCMHDNQEIRTPRCHRPLADPRARGRPASSSASSRGLSRWHRRSWRRLRDGWRNSHPKYHGSLTNPLARGRRPGIFVGLQSQPVALASPVLATRARWPEKFAPQVPRLTYEPSGERATPGIFVGQQSRPFAPASPVLATRARWLENSHSLVLRLLTDPLAKTATPGISISQRPRSFALASPVTATHEWLEDSHSQVPWLAHGPSAAMEIRHLHGPAPPCPVPRWSDDRCGRNTDRAWQQRPANRPTCQ
jgi:hypothetical protein